MIIIKLLQSKGNKLHLLNPFARECSIKLYFFQSTKNISIDSTRLIVHILRVLQKIGKIKKANLFSIKI